MYKMYSMTEAYSDIKSVVSHFNECRWVSRTPKVQLTMHDDIICVRNKSNLFKLTMIDKHKNLCTLSCFIVDKHGNASLTDKSDGVLSMMTVKLKNLIASLI